MIEIAIKDFVADALQVDVYMEFPAKPPTRFVVLKRSGEGSENLVETALVIADSYAESQMEASVLNEQVKSILDNLDELDEICNVRRSTDYPAFDTSNKRYRYQAVYEINHY